MSGCRVKRWDFSSDVKSTGSSDNKCKGSVAADSESAKELQDRIALMAKEREKQDQMWTVVQEAPVKPGLNNK